MEKKYQQHGSRLAPQIFTAEGVSFTMIPVRGGTFLMGAPQDEEGSYSEEKPQHEVALSDFRIGQTLVTQALWQCVMGTNPSYWRGPKMPVESVRWMDCQKFAKRLSEMLHADFRLPTEAEWEYAARGGQISRGYRYAGSNNPDRVAWYFENSRSHIHEVATKQPNELGLFDMSGNVGEWCQDYHEAAYYSISPSVNPKGPENGSFHIVRGGCFIDKERFCRNASRSFLWPTGMSSRIGLRLAMSGF